MSSTIDHLVPLFDGLNYLLWATQMRSYLKMSGLWAWVGGSSTTRPRRITLHAAAAASEGRGARPAITQAQADMQDLVVNAWDDKDEMITGTLTLWISHQFHHYIKTFASQIWSELEQIYGKPGPSLIFTDFKSVTSFRLSGGNPNQEISKLFTLLEHLKASKVELSTQIQAMILLCTLPPKWDNVAAMILNATSFDNLAFEEVRSAIVSEYEHTSTLLRFVIAP